MVVKCHVAFGLEVAYFLRVRNIVEQAETVFRADEKFVVRLSLQAGDGPGQNLKLVFANFVIFNIVNI